MVISIFGDSITSGENNGGVSYVGKIKLAPSDVIYNFGASGTTLGDYSLYPVKDHDLLHQLYKHENEIEKSNIIILEYGCNDISAICAKNVDPKVVQNTLVKCLDYINQTNSSCKVYFLGLGSNVRLFGYGQSEYLTKEWFKGVNKVSCDDWMSAYFRFIFFAKFFVEVIDLPKLAMYNIDKDGIHPNDSGYQLIADKIMEDIL